MDKIKIGIIGGTGMDNPNILEEQKRLKVDTKYGSPSSELIVGKIRGLESVLLFRHGEKHNIPPTEVPYQANILAMKELGCTHIIATTACGSLKEEIKPGDFVFVDQFIDRTTKRKQTFYEKDQICHIPMSKPFCDNMRRLFSENAKKLNLPYHEKGTIITIEGPRFSSRAESNLFRQWGADVINMTTIPEAVLARELGMHYIPIAISTDYDCWKIDEKPVNLEMIFASFKKSIENVKSLILETLPQIKNYEDNCISDISTSLIK